MSPEILSKIKPKVSKKIKELSFIPTESIDLAFKQSQYFFKSFCKDKKGEKFFFKTRIGNKKVFQKNITDFTDKNLRHEIVFYRFFSKKRENSLYKDLALRIPEYVNSGLSNLEWLSYKYVLGKTLGTPFEFDPQVLEEENIQPLISIVSSIQDLTLRDIEKDNKKIFRFKQHDFGVYDYFYDKKVRILGSNLRNYFQDSEINKGRQLLRKNRGLLNSSCNRLTHGDLHPKNIILEKKSQKFTIIDWETVHFNNQAYDPAFFWFRAWHNKKWQDKFLKTYFLTIKNKEKFLKLFQCAVIHRVLNEIEYWHERKVETKNKELKDKSLEALKSHTTTFKKALKSEDLFSY